MAHAAAWPSLPGFRHNDETTHLTIPMPFNPTIPVDGSLMVAADMRDQFDALKELIDAQPLVATGRVVADWTSSSSSFTNVGGLAFNVGSGENWSAEIVLYAISGTSGQGIKLRVAGPGAASVMIAMQGTGSSSPTAMECEVQTAFSVASPAKTFCMGSSLTGVIRLHVVIVGASAGTVQLQASNGSGSGTVTLKANSDLVARKTG